MLVHFNPQQEIILACDASAYGIGAVLSHRKEDGSEKPIGFASRTLSDGCGAEVFPSGKRGSGMRIWGHSVSCLSVWPSFSLITDNKAIMSLFDSNKPISPQASGRIKRWALKLATYEYTLQFRPINEHANADALSRLPLPEKPEHLPVPAEHVLLIEHLSEAPLSAAQLKIWTAKDPLLPQVLQYIREG